jgi:hypothetical protein
MITWALPDRMRKKMCPFSPSHGRWSHSDAA